MNDIFIILYGVALFIATGTAVGYMRASKKQARKISELRKMLKRIAEEI